MEEGTGIVHIAPGCGAEDFELSRVHDLPVLMPVDEAGRFYPDYGWLHGLSTGEAAEQIVVDLGERGKLISAGEIEHRFPFCWRCHTPLIFRIADDWFIAVEELRPKLIAANETVAWTPEYFGKRMEDWLRNMGDWNISRRRYFGLPLPFYPCECGHLTVVGSKAELAELATAGLDQLEELHRPWVDEVTIRCEACGNEDVRRIPEVGDVWLDAGIVPLSTLGWENPEWIEDGYATGASAGLSGADLPDHAYWETWFPADWVSEMREQIRLWFYSQLFMSVALVGRSPFRSVLGYEKMLDERGQEMHGSWGNMIDAEDAFARMGADVMRWQFCAQPPDRNLLFGYGPAKEIKRKLLTLWNSVRFLVDYGNIEGFAPALRRPGRAAARRGVAPARPLARRAHAGVRRGGDAGARGPAHAPADRELRGVRRRRLQLVHPPLAPALLGRGRGGAPRALARARPGPPRDRAGDAVPRRAPLAEPRRRSRARARPRASSSPAGRRRESRTRPCSRRSARCGRSSSSATGRATPPSSSCASRCGRSSSRAPSPALGHADEIAEELRVKSVAFEPLAGAGVRAKPNLKLLGPRLGPQLPAVARGARRGPLRAAPRRPRARSRATSSSADEVFVERAAPEGWALAEDGPLSVALDVAARPGARAGGPRLRPRARRQHDAQGAGARDHGPHRPHASRRRRPRRASSTGSSRRRSPSRSSTGPSWPYARRRAGLARLCNL